MLNKEIMKKAHQMTREIKAEFPEVNYQIQLGLCISYLLEEKGEVEVKVEEKLENLGYKIWKKNDMKRIYINDLVSLAEKVNVSVPNPKTFKKSNMYYDCVLEMFYYNTTSSRKTTVEEIILAVRNL